MKKTIQIVLDIDLPDQYSKLKGDDLKSIEKEIIYCYLQELVEDDSLHYKELDG
jgi:hypothetical protein